MPRFFKFLGTSDIPRTRFTSYVVRGVRVSSFSPKLGLVNVKPGKLVNLVNGKPGKPVNQVNPGKLVQ
jgi:hypothetical protein